MCRVAMFSRILVLFIAYIALCAWTTKAQVNFHLVEEEFSPATQDYDTFDWVLTTQVASKTENFLLSPLGLKLALALLIEVSTGATQKELASALGLELERQKNREKFASFIESLKDQSPENILHIGSKIYYLGYNLPRRELFNAIALTFYKTETENINFKNSGRATKNINAWISDTTQGKITKAVDPANLANMSLLILNALYFNGSWRHQFQLTETKPGVFYVTSKSSKLVPMMNVNDRFFYTETAKFDAKILRMPYLGNKYAMYVIVPNSLAGMSLVLDNINALRSEMNNLQEHLVEVSLPKFKIDYTSQLADILKQLGVRQAFEDTASFPGITRGQLQERLKISQVLQRTGIDVNELGSIGYSVIDIIHRFPEPLKDLPRAKVEANRPFLFFIQDEATRQLLFTGGVYDPTLTDGALKL